MKPCLPNQLRLGSGEWKEIKTDNARVISIPEELDQPEFYQVLAKKQLTKSIAHPPENGRVEYEYPDNLDLITFTGLFNSDNSSGNFQDFAAALQLLEEYLHTVASKTGFLPQPLDMRGLAIDIQHQSIEILPPYTIAQAPEQSHESIVKRLISEGVEALRREATDDGEIGVLSEALATLRKKMGGTVIRIGGGQ
ncbi:MAG TPA: hypothetical protein PKD19_01400 [Candidatus Saccharibacteria bacterium]|nr:hypothetical protein [Candidatus Saccharibacteria bacterium]HMR37947.1 hypothetical protein [Candidatus Saccharibacteria bacterium]